MKYKAMLLRQYHLTEKFSEYCKIKTVLVKQDVRAWTWFIWFRLQISGELMKC